ncbi:MAG: SDR family NAD(P)-dependent oxidoreductase [Planctomycetota bacterium]|nr:SDR family NAD(P)-dependent oxidoreductase [Planctomycetota bacterium]
MPFTDRSCLVTGGTGGLGSAVVRDLLECGADVHVTWREAEELERIDFKNHVTLHEVDLGDEAAVTAVFEKTGPLYASIHVAGGFDMAPVEDISQADFEGMMRLNAGTCFLCCREAVKAMRRAGRSTEDGGRIVNVIARPALEPVGGMLAYSISKAAVSSLTQGLAREVGPDGILVNAVAPSIMDTPANRAAMPEADFDAWPKVEEVARTMVWLASPANVLTTGSLVPVYGRV